MKAGTHKGAGRYQADRVDVRGITWNWIWSWVMSSGRSCRRFDSFSVTMRSITVRAIAETSIATVLMGGLVQAEKGIPSNPMSRTSSGTWMPCSVSSRSAPIAMVQTCTVLMFPLAGAVMRSMTEGGPQPPIRNITQRSISRYGRFRIVFSCGQIDISSEKVRNTPITGHKKNCLRITIDFYGDSVYGHMKRK